MLKGIGGPGRVRTVDLFHAMEARSQLRHRPINNCFLRIAYLPMTVALVNVALIYDLIFHDLDSWSGRSHNHTVSIYSFSLAAVKHLKNLNGPSTFF
jgi:hypothetical protein